MWLERGRLSVRSMQLHLNCQASAAGAKQGPSMGMRLTYDHHREDSVNENERSSMTLEATDLVWLEVQACEIQMWKCDRSRAQFVPGLRICNKQFKIFLPSTPTLYKV